MTEAFYEMTVLIIWALWQARSKDELVQQDSAAVSNQAGLYLVGLIFRVQLCFLLDQVEPKQKVLYTLMYNNYSNTDHSVAKSQLSLETGVNNFCFILTLLTKFSESIAVSLKTKFCRFHKFKLHLSTNICDPNVWFAIISSHVIYLCKSLCLAFMICALADTTLDIYQWRSEAASDGR